jgi:hypothetical protein
MGHPNVTHKFSGLLNRVSEDLIVSLFLNLRTALGDPRHFRPRACFDTPYPRDVPRYDVIATLAIWCSGGQAAVSPPPLTDYPAATIFNLAVQGFADPSLDLASATTLRHRSLFEPFNQALLASIRCRLISDPSLLRPSSFSRRRRVAI